MKSYIFSGAVCAAIAVSILALVQAYQPVPVPNQLPPFVDTYVYDAGISGEVVRDAGMVVLPEMTISADKPSTTTHRSAVKAAPTQKRVVGGVLDLHTIPSRVQIKHDPSNSFEYHSN